MQSTHQNHQRHSSLIRSGIIEQKSFYLKVDSTGHTQIIEKLDNKTILEANCLYRQVYDHHELRNHKHHGDKLFKDQDFQINLADQFGQQEDNYILKRLNTLYGRNKPKFIDPTQKPTKFKDTKGIPHSLHQLNLYTTQHYRGFFITQDFSQDGKYILIVCHDGKFQTICVDDYIPIDSRTLQPLWGLSYDRPWELILIKAWAKHKGGYRYIDGLVKPFQFVQSFSNPTWKYYNLVRQQHGFLNLYSNPSKLQNAKIILKTKSQLSVKKFGLMNNSAGYEIIDITKHKKQNQKQNHHLHDDKDNDEYVIAIRGTLKHTWTGSYTYLDDHILSYFNKNSSRINLNLDRDFLMSQKDLNLLFSAAYITARRQTDFFTGSKLIQVPANEVDTHYYQFIITRNGFFDFCLKQFSENAITQHNDKVNDHKQGYYNQNSSQLSNQRYLQNFCILVKDTQYKVQEHQHQIAKTMFNPAQSRVADRNSQYKPKRFMKYQLDFTKGYNRGDARFLSVQEGRYILRFKSQYVNKVAKYQLGWVSNSVIKPKYCSLSPQDKDRLLQQTFTQLIHIYPHYYLEKQQKEQIAVYAPSFQHAKYGFCGVKSTFNSHSTILMQCDPDLLNKEGYQLKGKFKDQKEKFIVKIEPGQYETIIFRKKFGVTNFHWPVKAISIFKKSETFPNGIQTSQLLQNSGQSNLQTSYYPNQGYNSNIQTVHVQPQEYNNIQTSHVRPNQQNNIQTSHVSPHQQNNIKTSHVRPLQLPNQRK